MLYFKNIIFILFLILINNTDLFGQITIGDSLLKSFNKLNSESEENSYSGKDTVKMNLLIALGNHYSSLSDFDHAILYFTKAKKLGEISATLYKDGKEIVFEKKLAIAIDKLSRSLNFQGHYVEAINEAFKALKINDKLGDKLAANRVRQNLGVIYRNQGNNEKALEQFNEALKTGLETGNKQSVASVYNLIGNIYSIEGKHQQAIDYHLKALQIAEEIGYSSLIASCHGNLGIIYENQGKFNEAEKEFLMVLKMFEKLNDKKNIAECYFQLGNICVKQIQKQNSVNTDKLAEKAKKYLYDALQLGLEMKSNQLLTNCYFALAEIENLTQNYKKSLEIFKLFIRYRDELLSEENNRKSLKAEMRYEFEKKESLTKAEQIKKDAISLKEKQKQTVIKNSFIVGFVFVIVFALILFKGYRNKQKAHVIISKQKEEVEQAKLIIELQKQEVEQKHKEITDSINYAERIQHSFLASNELLNQNLKEYFIFFQPKDVVSGDFYWASLLTNNNFVLVTADSTGHGVPGAIMSILNITSLEKSIEQGFCEPFEILNYTRKTIIERLKKDGSAEGGKDGMDASLISFDFNNQTLKYSAANNPIWIVREKNIIELSPDKMPVGKHDHDSVSFTQHTVSLQQGDVLYTLTDGLPDQFGGPRGKKFMYTELKSLLTSIATEPMVVQKQILKDTFNNWKGNLEQVDDVLIIGVKV